MTRIVTVFPSPHWGVLQAGDTGIIHHSKYLEGYCHLMRTLKKGFKVWTQLWDKINVPFLAGSVLVGFLHLHGSVRRFRCGFMPSFHAWRLLYYASFCCICDGISMIKRQIYSHLRVRSFGWSGSEDPTSLTFPAREQSSLLISIAMVMYYVFKTLKKSQNHPTTQFL